MSRNATIRAALSVILLCASPPALHTVEPPPRTSLSDKTVRFTVPAKPYAILKHDDLEAVVVDNRAVNDAVLPGHRAGYHGLGSLKHARQPRNLFAPSFSGLNFEHIHDGSRESAKGRFEPRNGPMELRVVDARTAELYQPPTPHWGLESCMRYQLLDDDVIEMTFECIPRRDSYRNGYIGLMWASYILQPESLDIHFLATGDDTNTPPTLVRGLSPDRGVLATHIAHDDRRSFARDADFPIKLIFNLSNHRYAEPWYAGICRGMVFMPVFRAADQVRLTQSPTGGGKGNPAWDFQWFIPDYRVGQRYQFIARIRYTPLDAARPGDKEFEPWLRAQADSQRGFIEGAPTRTRNSQ